MHREIDHECMILNLNTGTYYCLNRVGSRAWLYLMEYRCLDQTLESMLTEYDIPREMLLKDLQELVSQLKSQGLLEMTE